MSALANKLLLTSVFLMAWWNCFAQFEKEIQSNMNEKGLNGPSYFLGYFNVDSSDVYRIILPDSMNVDSPYAAFYAVIVASDSTLECRSHGGSNNFLWTQNVLGKKVDRNQTYFLIKALWIYKDYRNSRYNGFGILGTFHAGLYYPYKAHTDYCGIAITLKKKLPE